MLICVPGARTRVRAGGTLTSVWFLRWSEGSGIELKQKVVVLGAGGQLGQELVRTVGAEVDCIPLLRSQLDIVDGAAIEARLADLSPQVVINAAAYTAVDGLSLIHI